MRVPGVNTVALVLGLYLSSSAHRRALLGWCSCSLPEDEAETASQVDDLLATVDGEGIDRAVLFHDAHLNVLPSLFAQLVPYFVVGVAAYLLRILERLVDYEFRPPVSKGFSNNVLRNYFVDADRHRKGQLSKLVHLLLLALDQFVFALDFVLHFVDDAGFDDVLLHQALDDLHILRVERPFATLTLREVSRSLLDDVLVWVFSCMVANRRLCRGDGLLKLKDHLDELSVIFLVLFSLLLQLLVRGSKFPVLDCERLVLIV